MLGPHTRGDGLGSPNSAGSWMGMDNPVHLLLHMVLTRYELVQAIDVASQFVQSYVEYSRTSNNVLILSILPMTE